MPENWETMPVNTSCQAITMKAGTAEHTQVQSLFQATCVQTIIKVDYNKCALYVMDNVLALTSP